MTRAADDSFVSPLARLGRDAYARSIHENQKEHFAIAIPYIQVDLQRGEKCLYIADGCAKQAVRDGMNGHGESSLRKARLESSRAR
jgi:hypothetical protein